MGKSIESQLDPRAAQYAGIKFNFLTAVKFVCMRNRDQVWKFKCDCGRSKIILLKNVRRGHTKSCGCQHDKFPVKHGFTKNGYIHPFYSVWATMKARCEYPKVTGWKYYGARGIKLCKRWEKFENFRDDMLAGYKKGLTLDRIDCEGDYTPKNCRWTTWDVQAANRNYNRVYKTD